MIDFHFAGFLWNNVIVSVIVIFLLCIKKVLKKYTTASFQYYIWFALFLMLFLPFLPVKCALDSIVYHWLPVINHSKSMDAAFLSFNYLSNVQLTGDWLQEFSVSSQSNLFQTLNLLLTGLWIAGVLILTVFFFIIGFRLHLLKCNAILYQDESIRTIFINSKADLRIRRDITLYQSGIVSTPISFGILYPCIILPETIHQNMNQSEINYILLHELQHYKSMDILFNYVMCLSKIIYWFNPFIWYAIKQARTDREIACDASILKRLDEDAYTGYGSTIINYADKYLRTHNFSLALEFSGNKNQIYKRISEIILFKKDSCRKRHRSAIALLLVTGIVFALSPVTSVRTNAADYYDFANTNVEYEDLESYFKDYDGSFVLYDWENNKYEIYNLEQSSARVSPDSTYKIYSALFALENNVISSKSTQLSWDHTKQPFAEWSKDQDINSAMKYSVSWYFQELDKRQGIDTLKEEFKKIKYGNQDLSGGIEHFWAESSLRISPIEQVELLAHLYQNDYKFNENNVQTVKDSMRLSVSNDGALFGKTGTGDIGGRDINGWFIGYVETNGNTYFFATNIQNGKTCNGSTAAKITMSILTDKKIYSDAW